MGVAFQKAVAHGIVRAGMASLRGQKVSSGFWSGFVSSGFSVGTSGYGGTPGRTFIMAVVGGTTSELTGGKFANGAVTGAFIYLFNENALSLTKKFFSGISGEYVFGPKDEITQDLMKDSRLRRGIQLWKNTHSLNVGNKGFIDTGIFFPIEKGGLNLTLQFVGSYTARSLSD